VARKPVTLNQHLHEICREVSPGEDGYVLLDEALVCCHLVGIFFLMNARYQLFQAGLELLRIFDVVITPFSGHRDTPFLNGQ